VLLVTRTPGAWAALSLEITTSFAEALVELNEGRAVPLPCESPDVLARSIAEQADTLRWAESIGGQVTDDRGVQLGGYLLAYLLSRARVRELDWRRDHECS
jgi:hypothetical protein